ncbi:MAG: hypothetical protein KDA31_02210 [Phycisphaerales bacterium]|nr:hypothetical protein [Phycisphaerales bacterium]MCB9835644.1 hypothetical protein [Phycisphaera sp.]
MPRTIAAFVLSLVLALAARAQVVPLTLEASGTIAGVDPSGPYASVTPGTAFTIEFVLMIDIGTPISQTTEFTVWSATGEAKLTIDGMTPTTESGFCPVAVYDDPFVTGGDLIRFILNIPGGGNRNIGLRSDPEQDVLDINEPPSDYAINMLPISAQSGNGFAFGEQDAMANYLINGFITSFTATGGAPPPPPEITSQPVGEIINTGDTHNFIITAVGQDITYQWRLNGSPLTDGPGLVGSLTRRLQITPSKSGKYDCVVSNPGGTVVTNRVVLSVENNCPADQNGDGMLSPADFSAWVGNYNAGCP